MPIYMISTTWKGVMILALLGVGFATHWLLHDPETAKFLYGVAAGQLLPLAEQAKRDR